MAKLLQTLIPLFAFLLLSLANTARSQNPSTFFSYAFFGGQPADLTYQDDAHFLAEPPFLQLTGTDANGNAYGNSVGRVLHTAPVLFRDSAGAQADFQTTFNFIIRLNAGETTPADGLAFFIAPVGSTVPVGSSGGNLGIFGPDGNAPNVFAVEFDTFYNTAWDPSLQHVGIDIGSRRSSAAVPIPEGMAGREIAANIYYFAAEKSITVRVNTGSATRTVTMSYDLGNLLNDEVQVGLSASTGGFAARHEIKTWTFSSAIAAAGIRQVV